MSNQKKPVQRSFDRSIVEGPIAGAVWKLAWPTMLQNVIGGLQGIVDHAMVGHFVGFTGNAAIGVAWQIFLVVIVFITSLFTGMGVLVARFAGADDPEKVNRTVYQAFLTAAGLSLGILAPIGYVFGPALLGLVNAAPEVQTEALPYLRIMFTFSLGMLMFFMLGGALRAAGDAKTPLKLGMALTIMNVVLNLIFIPIFGTKGAAIGTTLAGGLLGVYTAWRLLSGKWVIRFHRGMNWKPDWKIIRALFKFGVPTGIQGVAMNIGGVVVLGFVGSLAQSAAAQAAYTVSYTQLFSLITWTSVGLMGATGAVTGQNLGAGKPERSIHAVHVASFIGLGVALTVGAIFRLFPEALFAFFGLDEPDVVELGIQLLAYLSVSGFFITVALAYTGALQGTGDTKSPLYISLVSQVLLPIGLLTFLSATRELQPAHVWTAILLGHITRAGLSVFRFRQGEWRHIEVKIDDATEQT